MLSGDELGVLIADHLIATTTGADRLVATTVVSSSMLSALAKWAGVGYVETLTGFKWIARAAQLRPHHHLLFGYEEALGYAVSDAVADKDGLSAAVVVADMAARAKHEGRSLLDRLDELTAILGVHATAQWSLRLTGSDAPQQMAALMGRWRAAPPERLAGLAVTEVRDLAQGQDGLPPSDVLVLQPRRRRPGGAAAQRDRAQAQGVLRGHDRARWPWTGWAGLAEHAKARLGGAAARYRQSLDR